MIYGRAFIGYVYQTQISANEIPVPGRVASCGAIKGLDSIEGVKQIEVAL